MDIENGILIFRPTSVTNRDYGTGLLAHRPFKGDIPSKGVQGFPQTFRNRIRVYQLSTS
jgi:hypothetical protein